MLLSFYRQPRRIKAFGSLSDPFEAFQGLLAGCTHATYLLYLLTYRAVQRARTVAPSVTPRTFVDDVGLQLVSENWNDLRLLAKVASIFTKDAAELGLILQPKKSAIVVGSRRARILLSRCRAHGLFQVPYADHVRNLGHELHGPRIRRRVEKKRLKTLKERTGRFLMLKAAVGRKATCLWRTGAMPSVSHGASVSGVTDATLRTLRQFAAVLNGAPGGSSSAGVTAYLITHPSAEYDPMYAASMDVVMKYAEWVWDGRVSASRLRRAWEVMAAKFDDATTWAQARGPLGATWLSLRRLGWRLVSPHVLLDDVGNTFDLHHVCPADLRPFLAEGVQRWQHERLQRHMYTNDGEDIWHRGLRYAVAGIRCCRQLGALQAHWADNIPIPPRRDMMLGRPMRPCQACGQHLAQDECWGHVFFQCPALLLADAPVPQDTGATEGQAVGAPRDVRLSCDDDGDIFPAIGEQDGAIEVHAFGAPDGGSDPRVVVEAPPTGRAPAEGVPDHLLEVRERLLKAGMLTGVPSYEKPYMVFGLPEPPVGIPPASSIGTGYFEWGIRQDSGAQSLI